MATETEKRKHRCCFTGHRPEKLQAPEGVVTAALEKSCNGYFIRLGQQLGAETLLQMSRQLGFGQEVPVAGALHAASWQISALGRAVCWHHRYRSPP